MTRYCCDVGTVVEGDVDLETVLARYHESFRLKGFFLKKAVETIGVDGYEALAHRLRKPQPGGRYLPFADYPTADFTLLSFTAARTLHPQLGTREAHRRWARDDLLRIGQTVLGKVTMSMVGDATGALLQYPKMYNNVAKGPWGVRAEAVDGGMHIHFDYCPSDEAYQVGQLEGITMHYGVVPSVDVEREGDCVDFHVHW